MKELSIRDTRAALAGLEELLEREGEIVITRHGRAVARIVPVISENLPTHAELRTLVPRESPSLSALVLAEREEGR